MSQSPTDSIAKLANVQYSTFEEFISKMMNFQMVLQENIAAFENHEAAKNFIAPRCLTENCDLQQSIEEWLLDPNNNLAMVYGGYGLGKTTFSFFTTAKFSKLYRSEKFNRIPIRISLSGLFTKQDLRALICSELTGAEGQPPVGNFSYNIFLQMVQQGLVLLILDGFDEMRHAMTSDDFLYTFEQMAPLFRGKSKVILLGRPDAFFNEEEETEIIKSLVETTRLDKKHVRFLEVAQFTNSEVDEYLDNFLYQYGAHSSERERARRLKEGEYDILRRPVQLNMFTKVISKYLSNEKEITRYQLYNDFVSRFVRRESEKSARKIQADFEADETGFSDPRSIFMQNIAWWISSVKRENRFLPTDVPIDCLPKELRKGKGNIASIREALIGSVLEHVGSKTRKATISNSGLIGRKGGNYFYFPHKSYIEFLVSQYFCREEFSKEMYRIYFNIANPEMISFVKEGPEIGARNIKLGLEYARGDVSKTIIEIAAKHSSISKDYNKISAASITANQLYVFYEYLSEYESKERLEKLLFDAFLNCRVPQKTSATLSLLLHYFRNNPAENLLTKILFAIFANLDHKQLEKAYGLEKSLSFSPSRLEVYYPDQVFLYFAVLNFFILITKENIFFKFDRMKELSESLSMGSLICRDYGENREQIHKKSEKVSIAKFLKQFERDIADKKKIELVRKIFLKKKPPSLFFGGRAFDLLPRELR
ncbi:hypothetical protein IWQ54_003431 [Labrenzia sp. EL_195]|nr:hypothetical protein [Labrenzia sp. EL_195]